jgi:hypothetical protein
MTTPNNLPYVRLAIFCFDRRRENPFPLFKREFWLDWEKLSANEIVDALLILKGEQSQHHPRGFDETLKTFSLGSSSKKNEIIKYRHAFIEVSVDDLERLHSIAEAQRTGGHILSGPHDYVEDENGIPISMNEMMSHVTGQEIVILAGDPKSVLQLGPTASRDEARWTVEKANTISQFLDVVRRIYQSEWYRQRTSITILSQKSGDDEMLEAVFPDDAETLAVLAYFRQLHAGDKLFLRACDAYLDHCGNEGKRAWIEREKATFKTMVDSPPVFFHDTTSTRREIIRMFMYGGGLLHSESKHGDELALASLIKSSGKHQAIVLFNSCLMDIYRASACVYHVIKQDFEHWIDDKKMTPPTRVDIPDLFSGFTSPPREA